MSDSLWPHGLQHTRLPCPSLSPRVWKNSYSLSQWCYPTILSSVIPFSSCPQSFSSLESFPVNQLFASEDQNIGASASALVFPINIQGLFPLGLTSLISLLSQFSSVTQSCLTLCNPMNPSIPGLPVHHRLPESTQTRVHWVIDAIQLSHPLSSPSPALNLSQHQGLFKWVNSSYQMAKELEFQFQHPSYQWTPRTDLL